MHAAVLLQWRRSITLGDIVRLLTDARSVVNVPERLGQLERNKVCLRLLCI